MYRVNYGNGQVSEQTPYKWRAQRDAERAGTGAFVEFYDDGTADDPGDWFPLSQRTRADDETAHFRCEG